MFPLGVSAPECVNWRNIPIALIDDLYSPLRFSLKSQPMISREFRAAIWPTQHLYI
jgi:hypothetical protein